MGPEIGTQAVRRDDLHAPTAQVLAEKDEVHEVIEGRLT